MRGQVDNRRGAKKPSFKGGKVLQRLLFFGSQRQASINEEAIAASHAPKSAIPKWATAGALASTKRRGRGGGPSVKTVENVATAYSDAAIQLATASPSATMSGVAPAPGSPPAAALWQSIGPTHITNGQTYGTSRVDVSGRVGALAIDPADTKHLLCGSAGGGVWESKDSGSTWQPRTDHMPTLTIGAIVFDPTNSKIAYAGSGEGNAYSSLGAGLYSSSDGGSTWTVLAGASFIGQGFYDLVVDSTKPKNLYAAMTDGFYVSTNAGVTWTRKRAGRCWDISVNPKSGGKEIFATFEDGLFVSSNFGSTFVAVSLPSGLTPPWSRLAVDHCRTDPRIAFVFGAKGTSGRLYQRSTAGAWSLKTLPAGLNLNQAWYDWLITASDKPGQVYIGAIDLLRGDPSGNTLKWVNLSTKTAAGSSSIHPDQHCLVIDPKNPDVIYAGNDGGVFCSHDRGIKWVALNKTLGITEIEFIAHRPDTSKWLLAGTQDNGTNLYTGALVWEHVADGDGGDCAVNSQKPNESYHSFYDMQFLERSTNAAAAGSWVTISIPGTGPTLFYPPLEAFGKTVARAGDRAFVSRNDGANWTSVGGLGFGAGHLASAMTMPNADQIYVGSTGGVLCRLDFVNSNWVVTPLASPRAAWISDIIVDPNDVNILWLTYTTINGPRVFQSTNAGAAWTDRTANLSPLPINAIAVDPKNSKRIFVASDLGVHESANSGTSWAILGAGLPNALAVDLALHEKNRLLFCATRNRGCWVIKI